ncbi:3'(2'),5'-bisphosphate nucleotidase [Mergibacter septicus]|uniref:3'(2'),5'-bisphosphate nucleotidase CysQ n=1 Tax=Mergibacter septicus TaxID=221402 RepID=A0A8D4J0J2_9PAST|nr:3'(2'),5'-bisphosphate nucleotidase CysQ [Mergibacter septicus]AWX15692.1 3'(2'),5'-bisphosphate nucleotidase [Mergibacter septicus]QDJ14945.1 3'(2'),5'-bisphosphate nucleotidase [Mergibacter septicus]UTU48858.1 3'(2'),5'-bisphosphate nucleotidase CysQ [Mergibacter septicus]WMR96840.1 3'(2'),5'-bisphosphate nucleotidase CysQ [Mergibacter septicus]
MIKLSPNLIEQVLQIAAKAGQYLNQFYQREITIETKSDNTPVTEADLFISQFLIQSLSQLTPNIPILSEESSHIPFSQRQHWQQYWLIDPLDGTQQFIDRTDQFSVLITFVENNLPLFGVIHQPITETTYYAIRQQGAFCHRQTTTTQLANSQTFSPLFDLTKQKQLRPINIAVGKTLNQTRLLQHLNPKFTYQFLTYGSSSLKALMVATGVCDCYIRLGKTGEWDTAAAEVLLGEVGGQIHTLHHQPLTYNQQESLINPDFIMVNNKNWNWQAILI